MKRYKRKGTGLVVTAEQWFPGKELPGIDEVGQCEGHYALHEEASGSGAMVQEGGYILRKEDTGAWWALSRGIFFALYEPLKEDKER